MTTFEIHLMHSSRENLFPLDNVEGFPEACIAARKYAACALFANGIHQEVGIRPKGTSEWTAIGYVSDWDDTLNHMRQLLA